MELDSSVKFQISLARSIRFVHPIRPSIHDAAAPKGEIAGVSIMK